MATIQLPTTPWAREATPRLLTFGSKQRGILGGPTTPIERLGSRFAIDVTMPPMHAEPNGRIWVARLLKAQASEGVFFRWPQLDLDLNPAQHRDGVVLNPIAPPGGRTVWIGGLYPGQVLREGQFVTLYATAHNRRFIHMNQADVTADGTGVVAIQLEPRLRATLTYLDPVEIVAPHIEGLLVGDTRDWNLDAARTTGLAFGIEERE